ncbi:glycosyltransferase family 2 protein [bacterium]|nr:glycosyltransferase family 2 protein [bacterium]
MTFLSWAILLGALINLLVAGRFYFLVRYGKSPALPSAQQENAVVIMAVRGCDPTLKKTVKGLLNQNFGDYRIVVVVDNRSDPAWKLLQQIKYESDPDDRMTLQEMDSPRPNCSLKCNAIIGAVESLSVETTWLAFVDADVEVYPDWLADLLGPLTNPKNCVSTGNQWFEPNDRGSTGALIRSIWNAGAMVPAVLLEHPWAGSMGVRYEDVIVSTLIDDWKTAIVDDGPMASFAKQMSGNVFVVPKLMMVNREDCTKEFAMTWISRMLTWARLYESTFWMTFVHAAISGGLAICLVTSAILSILTFDLFSLLATLLTFVVAAGMLAGGYWIVREAVSASLIQRGLPKLKPLDRKDWLQLGMWMGPIQLIYLYGCIKAKRARSISWRGVEYLLFDDGVELVEYRPYQQQGSEKSEATSL